MQPITPFLWFNDNAEEAAKFYTSVFKDSKITGTMPGPEGKVMGVSFELNGQKFNSLNGGPLYKFTEAISFMISCETQDEIDYYWNALTADGGEESQCGWLKDRFGLSWQVIPTNLGELLQKPGAMQCMLGMKKLVIEELKNA